MNNIFSIYDDSLSNAKKQAQSNTLDIYILHTNVIRLLDKTYKRYSIPDKSPLMPSPNIFYNCKNYFSELYMSSKDIYSIEGLIDKSIELCRPLVYPESLTPKMHYMKRVYDILNPDFKLNQSSNRISESNLSIFLFSGFYKALKDYLIISYVYEMTSFSAPTSIKKIFERIPHELSSDSVEKYIHNYSDKKYNRIVAPGEDYLFNNKYIYALLIGNALSEEAVEFSSFYDFLVSKALITTTINNNPYFRFFTNLHTERSKIQKQVFSTKNFNKFLQYFSFPKMKTEFNDSVKVSVISYLIERLTNINLINRLHKIISSVNDTDASKVMTTPLNLLALYPLVSFRIDILDSLEPYIQQCCQDCKVWRNNYLSWPINIMKLILYHSLFFIPLVKSVFYSYLTILDFHNENDYNPKENKDILLGKLFNYGSDDINDIYIIKPVCDYPESNNGYCKLVSQICHIFYESLTNKMNYMEMINCALLNQQRDESKSFYSNDCLPPSSYPLYTSDYTYELIMDILSAFECNETINNCINNSLYLYADYNRNFMNYKNLNHV